jgi:hypothetical protein
LDQKKREKNPEFGSQQDDPPIRLNAFALHPDVLTWNPWRIGP